MQPLIDEPFEMRTRQHVAPLQGRQTQYVAAGFPSLESPPACARVGEAAKRRAGDRKTLDGEQRQTAQQARTGPVVPCRDLSHGRRQQTPQKNSDFHRFEARQDGVAAADSSGLQVSAAALRADRTALTDSM